MEFNIQKKWFKAKKYGYGWTPSTWQGWVILAGYFFLNIATFFRIDSTSNSVSDTLMNFIPEMIMNTLALIVICYLTGEKPKWRWGK